VEYCNPQTQSLQELRFGIPLKALHQQDRQSAILYLELFLCNIRRNSRDQRRRNLDLARLSYNRVGEYN
jgi:hypothetical protein